MIQPIDSQTFSSLFSAEFLHAQGKAQEALLRRAEAARDQRLGRHVFIRAVIEISNFCRQNCSYCGMRRDNRRLERFRLERDAVRRLIFESLPPSVTDINFQAGEDPVAIREILLPILREISEQTDLGLSVCLGTLDPALYRELYQAGARYYIIKLETGNAAHYRQMQAPGTLEKRLAAIRHLAQTGWHVSSGLVAGLPAQTTEHLLETLRLLGDLPLAGASVSPFIPGENTPWASERSADLHVALNCLALLRLANPSWVIPAVSAFNILNTLGYVAALRAGANLATINMTPSESREKYVLYKRDRFIMSQQRVLDAIEAAGCEPSSLGLVKSFEKTAQAPLALA